MAQAENPQNIETHQQQQQKQHISVSNNFPIDLLQKFISGNHYNHKLHDETEGEDIELSLGLSLNGRFGVDPSAKKITRSSSIPDFMNPEREDGSPFVVPMVSTTNLARACSLPTETEEEWRKRKEMQTLRRMEAKRKRSEKQRNAKATRERNIDSAEESFEEDKRENGTIGIHLHPDQVQLVKNPNGVFGADIEGPLPPVVGATPSSQWSIGSQGSGSSGISESESQPVEGINKCSESPASVQSLSQCEQKLMVTPGSTTTTITDKSEGPIGVATENNIANRPMLHKNGANKEVVRNVLEDMPCVSVKGDGPNGKRIEGFLYRYKKGEEVRIVCVCHGSFLSPAEFVKHAGGGDVAHPLKHIVVIPSPLL